LDLEKKFYTEFHNSFVSEIEKLAHGLPKIEKEKVLTRSLTGLQENDSIRENINNEKILIAFKFKKIIKIFDINNVSIDDQQKQAYLENSNDIIQVEQLSEEINTHLDNQKKLAALQRKRSIDGQKFFQRIFNLFKNS